MNTSTLRRFVVQASALVLFGAVAVGCAGAPATEANLTHRAPIAVRTFGRTQDGVRGECRVTRTVGDDGSERIRGLSTFETGAGPATIVLEEATLDRQGRLWRATVELSRGSTKLLSVAFDAASGELVDRLTDRAIDLPDDVPLAYGPLPVLGSSFASPVAAWVAARAAEGSEHLRVVPLESPEASRVTVRSQVVVPDGAVRWVVLGDEAVGVDAELVQEVPMGLVSSLSDREARRAGRL